MNDEPASPATAIWSFLKAEVIAAASHAARAWWRFCILPALAIGGVLVMLQLIWLAWWSV